MSSEALEKVLGLVGNASALARALNVSKATVSLWRKGREGIPIAYCHAVERLVRGAMRCEALRPDHDFSRAAPSPDCISSDACHHI